MSNAVLRKDRQALLMIFGILLEYIVPQLDMLKSAKET